MCFGFLGIQFGFALQNTNVSRIFQTLGASMDEIPILWIAAPVTGLLVQPIIGYMSDKTWNSMGRRRPYFFWGAVLSTASLVIMPNSPTLWIAAGMLWILDASINISMEPFRAFVGDMLPDEQRATGYSMQSFFIGVGAVVASALPYMMTNWFDVSNTAEPGVIPDAVKWSFYWGGAVLFLAVGWTILRTKEYPPEVLEAFQKHEAAEAKAAENVKREADFYQKGGLIAIAVGVAASALFFLMSWDKELYILSGCALVFGIVQMIVAGFKKGSSDNALCEMADDLFAMPPTMRQLAVVQFFSWFAMFAMWIYATAGVTSFHFGSTDVTTKAYNDGADWVGVLFAAYNGFAALAAIGIAWLANRVGRKMTHTVCLSCGALGLGSFVFISNPDYLMLSMVGVGIAWASILSMPYAILSSALPLQKMGVYMGIFNFFIVIPQILAAAILGVMVKHLFADSVITMQLIGGISLAIAAAAVFLVNDPAGDPQS